MPDIATPQKVIRFGEFEVDLQAGRLFKRGVKVKLREQSFQVLAVLLEHHGQVVKREELQRRLWPDDVFVDFENNLNTAIGRLREALGDSAEHPRFIETLPKHGYRLIAEVSEIVTAAERIHARRARLVVLPFVNLSADAGEEYFSDAMTEEVLTELAALAPDHLGVIARTTAMRYKRTQKDVAQIGRELSVDYLVEGGVRRDDDRIAITVQLIRVSDQTHLFARRYEAGFRDVFNMRRSIAEAIAAQVGISPASDTPAGRRVTRNPTEDVVAYNLYRQGRHQMVKDTPESFAKAKQCFEEAISRDPRFALAYDALAELYWYLGFLGFAPAKDVSTTGMFHALRALDIDDTLAETHALLGLFRKELDFSWVDVKREMDRARELNPTSPLVRVYYAFGWLLPECRLEEAAAEIELALESDPQSVLMRAWLGVMLWLSRQYDRAIEQGRLMVELEPTTLLGYWMLGMFLRENGMFDQAIAAHRTAVELSGGAPLMLGWLGLALGQAGHTEEARALLERLYATANTGYVPPTSFAWTHFGLGDIDEAFVWMDRAVDGRDHMIVPIKTYPFLDPIRGDPRYVALLRKLNYDTEGPGTCCRPASASRTNM
jgi:TolB-like protein/Tfp pilus assembly protein PilF